MKLTRAELTLEGDLGRTVLYEAEDVSAIDVPVPALIIEVDDFEDALELLAIIDRSRARKKSKDTTPPAATAAVPVTEGRTGAVAAGKEAPQHRDPPKCIAPDCIFDADGGDFCRDHANATAEQKAEWKKAPRTEGGKRARKIGEQMDGGAPGSQVA